MTRPVDIVLAPSSELLVTWEDGSSSVFDPVTLRRICPCARCRELRAEAAKAPPKGGLRMAQGPPPAEVEIAELRYVGNYGLLLVWKDGHDTGIYTFRSLWEARQGADDTREPSA